MVEVDSSGRTLLTYAIEREPPTPQCITVSFMSTKLYNNTYDARFFSASMLCKNTVSESVYCLHDSQRLPSIFIGAWLCQGNRKNFPIIASYIYNDAYVFHQLSDIPLNGLIRPNKQQLCRILHFCRSLVQVLVDMCPQLLTERDGNHRLPLHLASIAASPVPLSLLLTHRPPKSGPPEVNCVDSLLRTPLHYSAAGNHLQNTQVTHICGYHQDTW